MSNQPYDLKYRPLRVTLDAKIWLWLILSVLVLILLLVR